ncbi:hypothetical protein [Leptospira fluminis]|nr:hypothetical protein [Leptospira fluminis]
MAGLNIYEKMTDPIRLIFYNEPDLVYGSEIEVIDIEELAQYIGKIILGHSYHIERIINSVPSSNPKPPNRAIEIAISHLAKTEEKEIEKRDGWIFQIISWITIQTSYKGEKVFFQIPHDAPAQHGTDGIAVVLDNSLGIKNIIITEDKATKNPRQLINSQVWPEFKKYEKRFKDSLIVNRISGLLSGRMGEDEFDKAMQKDIYRMEIRKYRICITGTPRHVDSSGRKELFKNYDMYVKGPKRRNADILNTENIRDWMQGLSIQVIKYLESLRN